MTDKDTAEGPTLEELKAFAAELAEEAHYNGNDWKAFCKPRLDTIVASLHELQRRRDAAAKVAEDVPEPAYVAMVRSQIAEGYKQHQRPCIDYIDALHTRCVALQARLKRLEDGLGLPTPEMNEAGQSAVDLRREDCGVDAIFKAMSAALLHGGE
jgi:hypothetical protein